MALTLTLSLLAPAALSPRPRPVNLDPALAALAAQAPNQVVRVMVGVGGDLAQVGSRIEALGGQVVHDLPIIQALAAELPAKSIAKLIRTDAVSWVALDSPVEGVGKPAPPSEGGQPQNVYLDTLGVRDVWALGLDGSGIGVAVIDSGISQDQDFNNIERSLSLSSNSSSNTDVFGHGTHVAGIIAGNGTNSGGDYHGIAPGVNLISLKISDGTGMAYESDTVAALQWVYDNKGAYNIRVVNLSIQSSAESSYHQSPLDAAAEILWFNGVVVVSAAGNWDGTAFNPIHAAPANDPFLITVGATDEKGSARTNDDAIASFSAMDETLEYYLKPEIHAPGVDIVSVLSGNSNWDAEHPDRVVLDGEYFRLSGTSMATPMVTGAVALLLQDEPNLTPDQVKYRLINTAGRVGKSDYLDVYAAVTGTTTESANTGLEASQLLWSGEDPVVWDSVNWNSVNWNSVNWNSVNWNSVNWNAVNWNATYWGE
jgi:serine protease AprX